VSGIRDRAVLALGFAGAFRRSELAALRVADLIEEADGLRIVIARSKTDKTGEGQEIVIPRGARIRRVEAVHLTAHLETHALMSADQIALYQQLRGYGGPTVPAHHHHR
jgi:integrase